MRMRDWENGASFNLAMQDFGLTVSIRVYGNGIAFVADDGVEKLFPHDADSDAAMSEFADHWNEVHRTHLKTTHQIRVERLMAKAGQAIPDQPTVPDEKTRILRAKLILEEAMETIAALGVRVSYVAGPNEAFMVNPLNQEFTAKDISKGNFSFNAEGDCDLVKVVDGCADVSVVTIGTLSACGVADIPVLHAVDVNNLGKFGPGGYRRDDGKWIKPPGHMPPDFAAIIEAQKQ